MLQIKTRDVLKGTVKAIDKSAVAAQRMKDAYVRVKDKAEHGYDSAESSPEEYATDRVSTLSDSMLHEAGHQLDRQGRKAVKETADNISKAKESFKQKKAEQPIQKAREQAKQAARSAGKAPSASGPVSGGSTQAGTDPGQAAGRIVRREDIPIRTRGQNPLAVRQSSRSAGNAAEFSDMQAARLGWSSYGDKQYVAHFLRYYPYGRAFSMGFGNQAIVELALSQLGQQGGQPYWSWYGFDGRVEWCACFVSWCANEYGYIEAGLIPRFSLCSDCVTWFVAQGQ
nr:hypothetical protein [Pseudoramibacter sp. HA2172]